MKKKAQKIIISKMFIDFLNKNLTLIFLILILLTIFPGFVLFIKNCVVERDNFFLILQKNETLNYYSTTFATIGMLIVAYAGLRNSNIIEKNNIRPNIQIKGYRFDKIDKIFTLVLTNNSKNYAYNIKVQNTLLIEKLKDNDKQEICISSNGKNNSIKISNGKFIDVDFKNGIIKKIPLNYSDSLNNIMISTFYKKGKKDLNGEVVYK